MQSSSNSSKSTQYSNAMNAWTSKESMSEEKVDMCYREYVKRVGFGVRRYNNRRNVNSNIISRTVHNHNLTAPQFVHHMRSHRRVTGPDLVAASSLHGVKVTPYQIHEFMANRSEGYDQVGYIRVDVQNRLDSNRRQQLKKSDAETYL
ncbi:hypothetical protein CUMW_111310, partial [Citrus unshiu]